MIVTLALAIGIPLVHMIMTGVVYGLLPKNWKSSYTHIDDNAPRFFAAFFWPMTGPFFIGASVVTRYRRSTIALPKATAREVR